MTDNRRVCVVCEAKFAAKRKDARYCSGRCRQRAARARPLQDELARRIDDTRRLYWELVQQYAEAVGVSMTDVCTELSPTVTSNGEVYIRGEHVGWAKPQRPGWTAWGLEAAPPPFLPPTVGAHKQFGPGAVDMAVKKLQRSRPSRARA
jgi:hypothetical protein